MLCNDVSVSSADFDISRKQANIQIDSYSFNMHVCEPPFLWSITLFCHNFVTMRLCPYVYVFLSHN